MGRYIGIIAFAFLAFNFLSCGSDPIHPLDEIEYNPKFVEIKINHPGFPEIPVNAENPLTEEGIELGHRLYYDSLMHPQSLHACATCHQQKNSFSSDLAVLPHVNLAFDQVFLWKGDVVGNLEAIMLFEVEKFFETDVSKLNNDQYYPVLFKKAFGIHTIETKHVAFALAQFLKTVNSYNAKYDQYLRHETKLTFEEKRGELIFFSELGDCFHCHGAPLFKDNMLHNNGLMNEYLKEEDKGHFIISNNTNDLGKFKTPTLRNIALTAPYMHDGRFETLQEVIDFYSYKVNNVPNVDPLMKQAHRGGIALEQEDIDALIAFLNTLTDYSFIENEQFSRTSK